MQNSQGLRLKEAYKLMYGHIETGTAMGDTRIPRLQTVKSDVAKDQRNEILRLKNKVNNLIEYPQRDANDLRCADTQTFELEKV